MADSDSHAPAGAAKDASRDDAAKARQRLDALLGRGPARASGRIALAGGGALDYDSCCEFVPVRRGGLGSDADEAVAAVFTLAYLARPAAPDAAPRPVCFAFNGGPGSASIWLHLGALGPRRVVVPDDATMPRPPYGVVDNPLTWLAHFDLVFIDPPHTGWSTSLDAKARKKVLSVDGDVDALVEVMRLWLTRHGRWGSPVYLAGESYGTTRGAAMADKLLDIGLPLAGLVLVSCAMDIQSISFDPGNDLPYATFLPGFAAVAQYHRKLSGPLDDPKAAREAAEAFAQDEYLGALHAGHRLGTARRTQVARRLSELTGLTTAQVEDQNLRIGDAYYFHQLLRDRGQVLGRLDARGTAPAAAQRRLEWEFDPGVEALEGPYTMSALAYFREGLGIDYQERYVALALDAHMKWNWNRGKSRGNSYCNTAPDLARALRRNPHLRVFVASGRFDLGTPYSASDYSLSQLDVPPEVLARITHHHYDAGHMMYTREADLRKLAADLAAWLAAPAAG